VEAGRNSTGSTAAKVQVIEFGDFQCPACGQAEPVVESFIAKYKGNKDVNFSFRNFPLPQHQYANVTAEAAEAAGAQGKYWEMHNKLYAEQTVWAASNDIMPLLLSYATGLGLDVEKFKSEVSASKYKDAIDSDKQAGTEAGVNATPTFFINGKKIEGVPSSSDLENAVEAALH
jgi:protein-disulfide isomerase